MNADLKKELMRNALQLVLVFTLNFRRSSALNPRLI